MERKGRFGRLYPHSRHAAVTQTTLPGRVWLPVRRFTLRMCLGLLLSLALTDRPALAHAVVLESAPAADASLPGPDIEVRLRFNSRVDHGRSRLALRLPDKTSRQIPISADASADTLAARVQGLAPGWYSLRWQVLAVDGHITRGDIPFQVIKTNVHDAAKLRGTPTAEQQQSKQPIR